MEMKAGEEIKAGSAVLIRDGLVYSKPILSIVRDTSNRLLGFEDRDGLIAIEDIMLRQPDALRRIAMAVDHVYRSDPKARELYTDSQVMIDELTMVSDRGVQENKRLDDLLKLTI